MPDTHELAALGRAMRGGGGGVKLSQLKKLFNTIDIDSSGSIDVEEVSGLLHRLGIAVKEAELEALVAEVDLDNNGTLEFVEFQEVLLQLSVRARNELRRQAEAGLHVVSAGPLLLGMLQESRAPKPQKIRCADMERERRLRATRAYSPRRPGVREYVQGTRRREFTSDGPTPLVKDDDEVEGAAPLDTRGAVMCRRSALGDCFPRPEEYTCAMLLHAFLEPISEVRGSLDDAELADADYWVPLTLLHREYVWARLSGYPDTPPVSGAQWQALLQRWLAAHAPTARLATHRGLPGVLGVRRVHPMERQPAVPGWDVLHLLTFFRVGKLVYVPWADDAKLEELPLQQLWPSLIPTGSAPLLSPMHSACGSCKDLSSASAPQFQRKPSHFGVIKDAIFRSGSDVIKDAKEFADMHGPRDELQLPPGDSIS